jgi:hypothetical protein
MDAVFADGVVHKTAGPWTPSVFALLRHLEAAGFAGAPRVVGQAFSYVPGESPHPHAWPDDVVAGVGVLLRGVHDATAGLEMPDAAGRARQAKAILDGYGLPAARRDALVDRLADVAIHSARYETMAEPVDSWAVTWRTRSASWIARHRELLRKAVH